MGNTLEGQQIGPSALIGSRLEISSSYVSELQPRNAVNHCPAYASFSQSLHLNTRVDLIFYGGKLRGVSRAAMGAHKNHFDNMSAVYC
jgi:hypothetical protein